jgi:hypothetical protein
MILIMNLLSKVGFLVAEIIDAKLGSAQINKIYCGTDLVFEKILDTTAPITTPRPLDLVGNPTNTYSTPQTVWLDVNEMCETYYTLDGGEPTTASAKYVGDGIYMDTTKVLKYFSVDLAGNTEAVKTTTYNINAVEMPISYISPSEPIQNTFPITVNITRSILEATTYYKIGSGAQQTFTAPFQVSQSTAGVLSTQIPITYWTVSNAGGTEAQRTLTYNTAGAIAGKAVVTATAGNYYVSVDWAAVQNATSYNVYRSTAAGTLGDLVEEYFTGLHYDDNYAINGTTYYYTVRAANYGGVGAVSDQAVATPSAAPQQPSAWRYLKIEGHGSVQEPATTRLIEFEAWEGVTNWMRQGGLSYSYQAISTGGLIGTIHDGIKTTSGYPIWWTSPVPNANIIIDFGTSRPFTKLSYYSYSTGAVPRSNRFKILGSNTNNGADWVTIWDNSTAQEGVQPALPLGYEKVL